MKFFNTIIAISFLSIGYANISMGGEGQQKSSSTIPKKRPEKRPDTPRPSRPLQLPGLPGREKQAFSARSLPSDLLRFRSEDSKDVDESGSSRPDDRRSIFVKTGLGVVTPR